MKKVVAVIVVMLLLTLIACGSRAGGEVAKSGVVGASSGDIAAGAVIPAKAVPEAEAIVEGECIVFHSGATFVAAYKRLAGKQSLDGTRYAAEKARAEKMKPRGSLAYYDEFSFDLESRELKPLGSIYTCAIR